MLTVGELVRACSEDVYKVARIVRINNRSVGVCFDSDKTVNLPFQKIWKIKSSQRKLLERRKSGMKKRSKKRIKKRSEKKSKKTSKKTSDEIEFSILPWGVLGKRLSKDFSLEQVGPEPKPRSLIVDPAGLPFLESNMPFRAGAASKAIYDYLNIVSFPSHVRNGAHVTFARFASYSKCHVVHVVGPDFRQPEYVSVEDCERALVTTYMNVFSEVRRCKFENPDLVSVRLLPVSGGVFSGRFAEELPRLTWKTMQDAFSLSSPSVKRALSSLDISVCVFLETELNAYKDAFRCLTD